MGYRLKTSKETEQLIDRIEAGQGLPWYTLARIAIALSMRQGPLKREDFSTDNGGKELSRYTVSGEEDVLLRCMIEVQQGRTLSDDEFFPKHIKAHLDRGAKLLDREERYSSNLLVHLTHLDKGI